MKPHWVLKTNRQEVEEISVLGLFSKPNILFTPIVKKKHPKEIKFRGIGF